MTALQTAARAQPAPDYDVERIRADFPILELEVNGKPLVYLDNAASSQMPRQVIERIVRYQTTQHANVNRGVHYLSETATFEYEEARRKVQRFINAREEREVIFTSGTTDAINLVAHGYGRKFIGAGDEYALSFLPGLFWKTEYRYSEFDRANVSVNFTPAFGGGPTGFSMSEKLREHSVRSELVYRFNWGGAPVAGKY